MKNFFKKVLDFFIPNSNDSQNRKITKILSILAVVVLIVGIIIVIGNVVKYAKSDAITDTYDDLYQSSEADIPSDTSDKTSSGASSVPADKFDDSGVLVELSKLYAENNDLIGHISIPDTKLSYPVVQGDDNKYYLDRTLYKKQNPFGVPFLDYRATVMDGFQSPNLTMYGHSANDGTFFAAVKDYKKLEFYKEHPTIIFDTIYGKGTYKIIGFFMEDTRVKNPKRFAYHDFVNISTEDGSDFTKFIDELGKRSYFDTTVDILSNDNLITLSTCSTEVDSSLTTPYREVLVARKVRPGESTEVDVAGAKYNEDIIMPDGWIKKMGKNKPF